MNIDKNTKKTLEKIINIINNDNISKSQLVPLLSNLLFSVGYTLEGMPNVNKSEIILKNYAQYNTLGWALMAQGKLMSETWTDKQEERAKDYGYK